MAYIISIKSNFLKLLENYGGLICGVIFNMFTAGAIFRNPPRNANDKFIRHAEATSKMPMTYILFITYPFRNTDDDNSSFRWLWFFLYFYFTSYFHPDFSAFCDFSNIFALSIELILAVTFWRCEKYCMRSRKVKHGFSRIISRICQHLKL